jgi:excisionase family DNA binding protein
VNLADAPDVLTVEQTAEVLHVARRTAYEAVRAGQIPSVRVGRCIRIPKHALERKLLGGDAERNGPGTDSPNRNGGVGAPPLTDKEYEHDKDTPAGDGAGRP